MGDSGLRLVVENLGPIGHATVAVRPLTVLIGRNNTGKTYLAQALYASLRAVGDLRPRPTEPLTTDERKQIARTLRKNALEEHGRTDLLLSDLSSEIQGKATGWIRQLLQEAGSALEGRLLAYFSEPEISNISRWDQADKATVELYDAEDTSCYFGTTLNSSADLSGINNIVTDWHLSLASEYAGMARRRGQQVDDEIVDFEYSLQLAAGIWYDYLQSTGLSGSAHYLPAGRSGLLHAWTDVVKLRIELERERFGIPGMPDTSLDGVALDFILSLAGIVGRRHRAHKRSHYELRLPFPEFLPDNDTPHESESLRLLRELMQGEIHAGSDEDMVPTLEYRQGEHRIALRRASSMVADLAPLAMWMDRIVEHGDLLIIDEPESHLHPEAIRLVARVLVRLVNEGVRVVCATHSPVLLHELSNCILRGRLPRGVPKELEIGYSESDILHFGNIAVHRFYRPDESTPVTVVPVQVEEDWGIPEEEYVKVASDLSDDSARLIDLLA